MLQDLVSTVIPVHNRGSLLCEAVASVLAQTWRPIEIIVVDDGSTDDTLAVARALEGAHPGVLRVVSQSNAGPGVARQAGVAECRGEFVQFLDSDDVLLPRKFELQVGALRDKPLSGIAYGKTYTRQPNGERAPQAAQRTAEAHNQIFPALLAGRIWETSTPLYRRCALEKIGPWPRKRQMEDWEFDAQAGAAGIELTRCDEFIAEYRIHAGARLAHAWMTDPGAMQDRLRVYGLVLAHARRAGVADATPELRRYARTLFAIAREAGRYGQAEEARSLLKLALSIEGSRRWDMRVYGGVASIVGWKAAGALTGHPEGH